MNLKTLEKIVFFSIALPIFSCNMYFYQESVNHNKSIKEKGYAHLSPDKIRYAGGKIAKAHRSRNGGIERIDLNVGYSRDFMLTPIIETYYPGDYDEFTRLERDIIDKDKE